MLAVCAVTSLPALAPAAVKNAGEVWPGRWRLRGVEKIVVGATGRENAQEIERGMNRVCGVCVVCVSVSVSVRARCE